ncbi:MAG: hypothetical protein HY077_01395 [Elusimicrobia bacterium]|nr:hypothetical protein [Elusimicrobiota bacterium]
MAERVDPKISRFKLKINDKQFDYSARDGWIALIKELLAQRIVAGTGQKGIDIYAFQDDPQTNAEDGLPENVLFLSLIDGWGIKYRDAAGVFEHYPDALGESDILGLIDLYSSSSDTFKSKYPWKKTSRLGFGLSRIEVIIWSLIAFAVIGSTVAYKLNKPGILDFVRDSIKHLF